jgi:hypothetical protein
VPVTAGVVGDLRLCATRAAQRVATELGTAAVFDGRHDLELAETEVAALLLPPSRPVGAEDIRDLQARHESVLRWSGTVQWADHLTERRRSYMGIERRGLELLVAQQHLDGADVFLLFQ